MGFLMSPILVIGLPRKNLQEPAGWRLRTVSVINIECFTVIAGKPPQVRVVHDWRGSALRVSSSTNALAIGDFWSLRCTSQTADTAAGSSSGR